MFVDEILTFTALQSPINIAVDYIFDHGDGTLDPGAVSSAFYEAPGSYNVVLRWSHAGGSGTTFCGVVTVVGVVNGTPTPTPTPTTTTTPTVRIGCRIEPLRTMFVGEILTYTALQDPLTVAVDYVFDHGDGTLDPGPVSHAFYEAPGSYSVLLRWSHAGGTGTTLCGVVTVTGVVTPL